MDDISLRQFTAMDQASNVAGYVHALETFDSIEQLQELKVIARQHGEIARGCSVLDVGCGFGLETLRLAGLVAPGGKVAGIDKSGDFIAPGIMIIPLNWTFGSSDKRDPWWSLAYARPA